MVKIIDITELRDLDIGDYFKLTPTSKKIYRKSEYDTETQGIFCDDVSDISRQRLLKRGTVVCTEFEY